MSDSDEELLRLCYARNQLIAEEIKKRLPEKYRNNINVEETPPPPKRVRKKKDGIRNRTCWVADQLLESNRIYGVYGLAKGLISTDDRIVQNLNMSPADFYEILNLIQKDIKKKTTFCRDPVPPDARLGITLKFLNNQDPFRKISETLGLGCKSVGIIVLETCKAIYTKLEPIVLPHPTMEKLCESAAGMKELTKFPNCVGVLTGRILYVKKFFQPSKTKGILDKSIPVLFALSDPRCCFLVVKVLPDRESNIQVFLSSLLENMIPEENMPPPNLLSESGSFLPHVVLGNECFPLSKYVMTPYTAEDLLHDPNKGIYNQKHFQVMEVAENTIGLMAQRYRKILNLRTLNYDMIEAITRACCCLHNFLRLKELSAGNNGQIDENSVKEVLRNAEFRPLTPYTGPASEIGQEVRQNFLTQFTSECNVAFNEEYSHYQNFYL